MGARERHGDRLRAAGFAPDDEGPWRDALDAIGAVRTPSGTFVGWLDVTWPGPAEPRLVLRSAVHVVTGTAADELAHRVALAERRRERALRRCVHCRQRFTPGHMHDASVGHGCAERHVH